MTEAQAWRTIADAYYTPRGERTDEQENMAYDGICNAVSWMPSEIRHVMLSQIMEDTKRRLGSKWHYLSYICRLRGSYDILRADYCILQAEIAETGGVS